MPPTTTAAVINKAKTIWEHDADLEITLEANPGSSEAKKFQEFRKAGVNRLSLGVQSFRDEALKFLGRVHNSGEALGAIELARGTFPRFSFDLMYALPGQTLARWEEELGQGLDLAAGHVSLYQLTLEKDTAFYRQHKRGLLHLPPEGIAADLYTLTNKMCARAGLPAYETSNYAKPGFESRHNLNYWQGGAYAGIGPGAHSRIFSNGSWRAMATHKNQSGDGQHDAHAHEEDTAARLRGTLELPAVLDVVLGFSLDDRIDALHRLRDDRLEVASGDVGLNDQLAQTLLAGDAVRAEIPDDARDLSQGNLGATGGVERNLVNPLEIPRT